MTWLARLPWPLVVFGCLSIGLSPFAPPHLVEKLRMLVAGTPMRAIDWFDLVLHGAPWVVLGMKAAVALRGRGR